MYRGGGVQNQAEINSKNAFRPVPVQKFTFPVSEHFRKQFRNFKRLLVPTSLCRRTTLTARSDFQMSPFTVSPSESGAPESLSF